VDPRDPGSIRLSPANPFSHAKTFVFTPNRIIPNLSVSPCMKKTESEKGIVSPHSFLRTFSRLQLSNNEAELGKPEVRVADLSHDNGNEKNVGK
jgi:hypothetical protein